MKKGLKTAIVAIALVTAGMGAFATKANYAPKAGQTSYTWTHYSRTGQIIGTFTGTEDEAKDGLACNGSNEICADAPGTSVVLRYLPL